MNTNEITFEIVPASAEITPSAKTAIESSFGDHFVEAQKLVVKSADIDDAKQARAMRLELKAVRVAGDKTHKALKEQIIREGRAIDGAKNILIAMIAPHETRMEEVEKAAERAEAACIQALHEDRLESLETIGHDHLGINLGILTPDQWEAYHTQAKDAFFARREREKKAAEEAAAKAKAEAEAREAQRLENIRLKEEADKREAEIAKEREAAAKAAAKAAKERAAVEAKAAKERAEAKAAADKEREEANRKLMEAAKEKARLEAEAKALRDAESKRIADEKAAAEAKAKAEAEAAKKAAAAPDKLKLMRFVEDLSVIRAPEMKTKEGRELAEDIDSRILALAKWIQTQAATL